MRDRFEEQLRLLNKELTEMGTMVEKAIQRAIDAFLCQDVETAQAIMQEDDAIDNMQKKIENICFGLLIQQQPVARDLRNITAAMKMVTDMERIGDHATDISEITVMTADIPYQLDTARIRKMASETIIMLLQAIESYVERDIEKAKKVIAHDDIVDDLFLQVKSEIVELMKNNPSYEEHAADMLMVDKYLERIGDHATNIAEWVIFANERDPRERKD